MLVFELQKDYTITETFWCKKLIDNFEKNCKKKFHELKQFLLNLMMILSSDFWCSASDYFDRTKLLSKIIKTDHQIFKSTSFNNNNEQRTIVDQINKIEVSRTPWDTLRTSYLTTRTPFFATNTFFIVIYTSYFTACTFFFVIHTPCFAVCTTCFCCAYTSLMRIRVSPRPPYRLKFSCGEKQKRHLTQKKISPQYSVAWGEISHLNIS